MVKFVVVAAAAASVVSAVRMTPHRASSSNGSPRGEAAQAISVSGVEDVASHHHHAAGVPCSACEEETPMMQEVAVKQDAGHHHHTGDSCSGCEAETPIKAEGVAHHHHAGASCSECERDQSETVIVPPIEEGAAHHHHNEPCSMCELEKNAISPEGIPVVGELMPDGCVRVQRLTGGHVHEHESDAAESVKSGGEPAPESNSENTSGGFFACLKCCGEPKADVTPKAGDSDEVRPAESPMASPRAQACAVEALEGANAIVPMAKAHPIATA